MAEAIGMYLVIGMIIATLVSICVSACSYTSPDESMQQRFSWFMMCAAIFVAVMLAWLPAVLFLISEFLGEKRA